jgi:hypothetical protein
MKQILWIAVAGLMLVGCGKKQEAPPAAPAAEAPEAVAPVKPAEAVAPAPAPSVPQKVTESAQPVAEQATGKYAALLNAFQGADAGTLANVQKAVAAMEGGKWSDAIPLLQQLLAGDLTAGQKQAVEDALVQSQKEVAASAAQKSLGDATKSLPFGK